MKVSQKQQKAVRKKNNFSKGRTKAEYESIAGGRMQNKIWKPREKKQATADDDLQNKVWDPGRQGKRLKTHEQEIMIIFNLASLMQEHQAKRKYFVFY